MMLSEAGQAKKDKYHEIQKILTSSKVRRECWLQRLERVVGIGREEKRLNLGRRKTFLY